MMKRRSGLKSFPLENMDAIIQHFDNITVDDAVTVGDKPETSAVVFNQFSQNITVSLSKAYRLVVPFILQQTGMK